MPEFRNRPTKRAQQLRNNATQAERLLWQHLSRRQLNGCKFSRQMPLGPFICDFLCREHQLIVEVDGGQHCDNARDLARTAYLQSEGYRVIRFWNNDVLENIDGVLQTVAVALEALPPPTPSRKREGKSGEAAKGWAPTP
jgi:very-short-patch-repair endonuclease